MAQAQRVERRVENGPDLLGRPVEPGPQPGSGCQGLDDVPVRDHLGRLRKPGVAAEKGVGGLLPCEVPGHLHRPGVPEHFPGRGADEALRGAPVRAESAQQEKRAP
ncbi:hypothetical protein ACFQ0M_05680 [Kitasatospora aburaviensis]